MMKVNDTVKIKPCSEWANAMVQKYGPTGKVGKIGSEHVMLVNDRCTDIYDSLNGGFIWGYWLHQYEATLEVI